MDPEISISTVIRSHEDPRKVIDSIMGLFPQWTPSSNPVVQKFPNNREDIEISGTAESLDNVLSILRDNRILDTALDAMTMNMRDGKTTFSLSRQSALVGKVSFVLDGIALGGTMEICLQGEDLGIWLEQQTWHVGRDTVPRSVGDDLAMSDRGEPMEWFDSNGRKMKNQD